MLTKQTSSFSSCIQSSCPSRIVKDIDLIIIERFKMIRENHKNPNKSSKNSK